MQIESCCNCAYFKQHYVLNEKKLFRINCGHCMYKSPRQKKPGARKCDKFIAAVPDEEAFVQKEYLSKALLQYMLQLELLPEIYQCKEMTE